MEEQQTNNIRGQRGLNCTL